MMLPVLIVALLQAAPAQNADDQLIAVARAASARFHDRNAAIRAGYRRLGPDIPEMGEHWVNPILVVEARYDPAQPSLLTYTTINGKSTLTGVGYVLALRAGESPPPTGVSGDWHDHSATVTDELTLGGHDGHAQGARVVVMHAWVWVENPDGVFADANWALPYIRSGLPVPARIDTAAARGVSLLSGGVDYYAQLLYDRTGRDFRAQLESAAAEVQAGADPASVWRGLAPVLRGRRLPEPPPAGWRHRPIVFSAPIISLD